MLEITITVIAILLTIYLALAAPINNVNLLSPQTNIWTNGTNNTIAFIFNYTGDATTANCTLYINDLDYGTNTTTQNNTQTTIYANDTIPEGLFNWTIFCINETGNGLYSENRSIGIDTTAPTTTDDASSEWTNESVTITLTPDDTNGIIAVSGINKTYYCNDTDNTCTPDTEYTAAIALTIEGINYLRYYSTDNASNNETIQSTTIRIDLTKPELTIQTPENNTWTNNDEAIFSFYSNDTLSNTLNCTLIIDKTTNQQNETVTTGIITNITSTSLTESTHNWSVKCQDLAGNTNKSETRVIKVDTTAPTTTDDAPTGWTRSTTYPSITLIANDTNGVIPVSGVNKTYYCLNSTDDACTPDELFTGVVLLFNQGTIYFRYYSTDNASNTEIINNKTLLFDNTAPIVYAGEPANNTEYTNTNQLLFNLTSVSDNVDSTMTCGLYIDGTIKSTQQVGEGSSKIFPYTITTDGAHEWYFGCQDDAGNTGYGETKTVIVSVAPNKPRYNLETTKTDNSQIQVYGYVNKSNSNVTVYASQTGLESYSQSQITNETATKHGEAEIYSVWNETTFLINRAAYGALFTVGRFIEFENHNRTSYLRYEILRTRVHDATYNKVTIKPAVESIIIAGETIKIYNQSKPTGWFNITIDLHEGNNTITVRGNRFGNDGVESEEKSVYYDNINPEINTTEIPSTTNRNTLTINFTITDDYAVKTSTIIVNVTNSTSFVEYNDSSITCNGSRISKDCAVEINLKNGYYNISISVSDDFNHETVSPEIVLQVNTNSPGLVLISPENNYLEETTRNLTISFNTTDLFDADINCSLYLNNIYNTSKSVIVGEVENFTLTNLVDQTITWKIRCENSFENINNSEQRIININNTPIKPKIWTTPTVLNNNTINIIGLIGKNNTLVTATIIQGERVPRTFTTTSIQDSTISLTTTSVRQEVTMGESCIYINKTLNESFVVGQYVEFSNHNKTYYSRYTIQNQTNDWGTGENQYYVQVCFEENLTTTIAIDTTLRVYNTTYPKGWFNITIDNLFLGLNKITLTGSRYGLTGIESNEITIYSDLTVPEIDISGIPNYSTTSYKNIEFIITDNYKVNESSIVLNITGNNQTIYHTTNNGLYNNNWTFGEEISCTGTNTQKTCNVNINLVDSIYNLTFTAADSVGWTNSEIKENFTADTVAPDITRVDTIGSTTSSTEIYANWTDLTTTFGFDHYEYCVGTKKYPTEGYYNNVLNWTNVGQATNTTTTQLNLTPGTVYYINIKAIDEFGNFDVASSGMILYEDTTAPVFNGIIINSGNLWSNNNASITANWSFTDLESGVASYKYAVGTARYPFEGWNSLTNDLTEDNAIEITSLNLEDGQIYYVSVKAYSNYSLNELSSIWYSSSAVKIDTIKPVNGTIQYNAGSLTVPSIAIIYGTGTDTLSGLRGNAEIRVKYANLSQNAQCGGYSSAALLTNVSLTTSSGTANYVYNGLEDGTCYKFELWVYDIAGNVNIYNSGNQVNNLKVDTTPPPSVTITDQGTVTNSPDLMFTWIPVQDLDSGVGYYTYALGTSPGQTDVVGWTQTTEATAIFRNLNLEDEDIYYLSVIAYNNIGGPSETAYSDGIIYLDASTPNPVTVVSVGNDTNGSDGYLDTKVSSTTIINLTGEESLSCVWSLYDVDYAEPGQGAYNYTTLCNNTNINGVGIQTCNIANVNEGAHNVYVICKDGANNKQSSSQNTHVSFIKDNSAPEINITSPENNSLVNSLITANVLITDASNYTARYELREYYNRTLNTSGIVGVSGNISLDLSNLKGVFELIISATDIYSRTRNESVVMIVDNTVPSLNVVTSPSRSYFGENFDLTIRATLLTNASYNITNSSGQTILSSTNTSNSMRNSLVWTETVDVSSLSNGNYTINVQVINNNSNITTSNYWFYVDKDYPRAFSRTVRPNRTIYDNDSIQLEIYWEEVIGLDSVWVKHNANGSYVNYTASQIEGEDIWDYADAWQVTIPSYLLKPNQTITYTWYARDKAYNTQNTGSYNVFVTDRAPIITTTNLSAAWENVLYSVLITFNDSDTHNDSNFNCFVEPSYLNISYVGNKKCLLQWLTPNENISLNVTISDSVLTTTKAFNLTVYQTETVTNNLNSSHATNVEYWYNGSLVSAYTMSSTSTLSSLTIPKDQFYTVYYEMDKYSVWSDNLNISEANSMNIFFRKKNNNSISNANKSIGSGKIYKPLEAFVLEMNSGSTRNYSVAFNYSSYSSASNLEIFKFSYDKTTNTINYSDGGVVLSSVDSNRKLVYTVVDNFSVFILVRNTSSVNNDNDDDSTDPGGSSRSSSSSGSSFLYTPKISCNDNISNQGEIGVDCGGPCPPCVTCHDGLRNQGEAGVDCGGPCSACHIPSCTDGIMNYGEEEKDCGGPCKPCKEIFTCDDNIQNGFEEGVDCGGSCIPCPGCNNGIRDEGEEGVDCGEICSNECGPTIIEKAVEVKKIPAFVWAIIATIILLGGGVAILIYAKEENIVKSETQKAINTQEELNEFKEEEKQVVGKYILDFLSDGLAEENIRSQLLSRGFKQPNVDAIMASVLRDQKLLEIQDYITQYSKQGYSKEQLKDWMLKNGVDENLIDKALNKQSNELDESNDEKDKEIKGFDFDVS